MKMIAVTFTSAFILSTSYASIPTEAVKPPLMIEETQATTSISLNTANAAMLSHVVHGIGKKRAEAIIAYREIHGPFKAVGELESVPGIGRQFVLRNLALLEKSFSVK